MMLLGEPSRWRGEFAAFFDAGIVQQVTTLAPCSVLVVRNGPGQDWLLHLHRWHLALHAGGAPRGGSRPCHGRTHYAFFRGRYGARPGAAEEAVANAKALLKAMTIPVHETKVAVGDAVEEIVESGSLYKIIVVTDEGRSRFQRLFRGSIATEVVRKARTSVLDVR